MSENPSAFAVIPAYSHIDDRLQNALMMARLPYQPAYRCSDLPKARSQLLSLALTNTTADVIVMVDSDMAPEPGQFETLIELAFERGAASGAYVVRNGGVALKPFDGLGVELGVPGLRELDAAGLGFCAVRRQDLMRVRDELPTLTAANGIEWWPFCVPFVDGASGTYYPDDYAFWWRWRRADLGLWLDQELLIPHVLGLPCPPPRGFIPPG